MHRGFNYYYREGLKTSGKTLYRNKCYFRFILYFLAEFFGRILIVFNPHFNLANMRQGYVIRKACKLNVSSAFRNVGHRVSIWTYILTLCLEGLIIIAGIAAVAILAAILGSIGYAVGKIASFDDYELMILLFAAPSALLMVLYVLITLLIFSPTAYIMNNNENVSAGETIGACYRSMLNSGKMTVFLTYFVSGLIKSLYLGAMGTGGYFLLGLFPQNLSVVIIIGWSLLTLLGYLSFAPILTLANRVVKEHLFEDIVLDPVTAARVNEKVNLSVCNGKKIQPELAPQNLASLFEYTEDPYKILKSSEEKAWQLMSEKPKTGKKPAHKQNAVKTSKVKPSGEVQPHKAQPHPVSPPTEPAAPTAAASGN